MSAATGTAAACSKESRAGFGANETSSPTDTSSANEPAVVPYTSSPRLKAGHIAADSLDHAGEVVRGSSFLSAWSTRIRVGRSRGPGEGEPVELVEHRGFRNPDRDHVVFKAWRCSSFPEFEDIRRAISVVRDCLHRNRVLRPPRHIWQSL